MQFLGGASPTTCPPHRAAGSWYRPRSRQELVVWLGQGLFEPARGCERIKSSSLCSRRSHTSTHTSSCVAGLSFCSRLHFVPLDGRPGQCVGERKAAVSMDGSPLRLYQCTCVPMSVALYVSLQLQFCAHPPCTAPGGDPYLVQHCKTNQLVI